MKITLLHPVQHDGKAHKEGDTLSMDDAQAQSLIDCGAAEKAGAKAKADGKADAKPEADAAAAASTQASGNT